jgi:hypothetical protein
MSKRLALCIALTCAALAACDSVDCSDKDAITIKSGSFKRTDTRTGQTHTVTVDRDAGTLTIARPGMVETYKLAAAK